MVRDARASSRRRADRRWRGRGAPAVSRKAHRWTRRHGISAAHCGTVESTWGWPLPTYLGARPQLGSRTAALRVLAAASLSDRVAVSFRWSRFDEFDAARSGTV